MQYDRLASEEAIIRTKESLEKRGVNVIIVSSRQEALKKLEELLPEGVELMTGGSTTLEQIGFVDFLIHNPQKYNNLKNAIFVERDPAKQSELRRRSNVAEYYIGSVHAVAETGEVVVASATGSQLGAYAYGSEHVIWVVGTQKITPTLEDAIRRVEEYTLPLEDQRMKSLGSPGSHIGKMLIFHDDRPGRTTMILVREKLGF